jgi:hypothetical protein
MSETPLISSGNERDRDPFKLMGSARHYHVSISVMGFRGLDLSYHFKRESQTACSNIVSISYCCNPNPENTCRWQEHYVSGANQSQVLTTREAEGADERLKESI